MHDVHDAREQLYEHACGHACVQPNVPADANFYDLHDEFADVCSDVVPCANVLAHADVQPNVLIDAHAHVQPYAHSDGRVYWQKADYVYARYDVQPNGCVDDYAHVRCGHKICV